jgi:dCTP deaminase
MLSDSDIKDELGSAIDIFPRPDGKDIQPASVDLHISNEFATYSDEPATIDLRDRLTWPPMTTVLTPEFVLHPHQFALATTRETISLRDSVAAKIEGRSSFGRLGLLVHATAGFIDPGFRGQITLELYNLSRHPFVLREGDAICQVVFHHLHTSCREPYGAARGSKYQDQEGVQLSLAGLKVEL